VQTKKQTNWEIFRNLIRENLTLGVSLKANKDIEDYVHQFVQIIQQAAWNSTPYPQQISQRGRMRTDDQTENFRKEEVEKTVAKHQFAAR
jgi:hypothetical protein